MCLVKILMCNAEYSFGESFWMHFAPLWALAYESTDLESDLIWSFGLLQSTREKRSDPWKQDSVTIVFGKTSSLLRNSPTLN